MESELHQIVYFQNSKQEICIGDAGPAGVFMTAYRLGFQEKYISAIGKNGEKDVKLIAEVV